MRSESELFLLFLTASKEWITTQEIATALVNAVHTRDQTRPLRFGLEDTLCEMLMGFLAAGWLEVRMPPGEPEKGEWRVNAVGRQVLSRAPADLQARLGLSPKVAALSS